ncbi:AAA family ATPase [Ligilactobacillus ruminis]|uniref:Nuclease SbcCD subunit C n=1 Tax=Ligilactobacillus ruminis TaxID=1623 RepID=A0AAQ2XNR9_9LACO|nr:AAA family ATPase [Ligilactobacillus ruminis]WDC81736.1 AAA family ATPase [Ligilactobacillus ruminis]
MAMKIAELQIENVKRVKAVKLEPSENGLTIIGGDNAQGKTSVLDAIVWALGGNKYKPSEAQNHDSILPPKLHLVMNNGLVVERAGKTSALKVIDPSGKKGGQQLLNSFTEELALNLPKFMEASEKSKADTLLRIIGVGDQLAKLDQDESKLYNERHAIGQIADQKEKYAKEMVYYPDTPNEPVSVSELVQEQQAILLKNAKNREKREQKKQIEAELHEIEAELEKLEKRKNKLVEDLKTAEKTVANLHDEETAEIEKKLADVDDINRRVRANLDREKAEDEAREHRARYDHLSSEIDDIREKRQHLLDSADLPLPGLSVTDGKLTYKGVEWDCMSSAEQLKVATAIVRKLKPECGFVLMDKLEQMDLKTLKEFGAWLEEEGLQCIATRVSTGDECSIIIEDGKVKGGDAGVVTSRKQEATETTDWKGRGAF